MSGTIRDLVVGIDFSDINIQELLRVDSAMDEIEDQLQSMGISIDDASQEINDMGSNAHHVFNQMASSVESSNNSMQTHFNNTAATGHKMLTGLKTAALAAVPYITGAISAAYGAIVATVMETESAFDRLEAKTGTTGAELAGLKNVASDVFRNGFGQDLTQVTDDVAGMRSMFKGLNDEELAGFVKNAYTISDLWGPEVSEIGATVKTMTEQFKGLSQANALDLMTTAFQKTGDYSGDLLDTFNEYSVYFKELGFDAKGFTNVLIKGSEAGAFNLDKVGDAIKEVGIRAMDGSKSSIGAFKEIGLNGKKMTKEFAKGGDSAKDAFAATVAGLAAMKDPVKQNQAGVALFGTQWEDLRSTVVLAMSDGKDAVGEFKGATQAAGVAAYDNFGSRMTSVFRDLKLKIADAFKENGGAELLATLATKAEELVPKIESLVGKAIDFANTVKDNWPAIRETTIGIGTAVGSFVAIMGTMSIIKTVTTFIRTWRTVTLAAAVAQLGLNAAVWANPITWLIAGIAALIGIGVLLYRNWDTVKAKTESLWNKLGAFKGVATLVLGPLGLIIRAAVTMAKNWDSTKSVWENVWNGIKLSASNAVNDVIGSINKLIGMINKIPGVNVPVIPKVHWGAVKGVNENAGTTIARTSKVSGGHAISSHATGLESVPYDDYKANLHKGEAVLTAKQSNALRAAGILSRAGNKPKLSMGDQVSPTGKTKSKTTVFSPSVTVQVNGASGDAKEIGKQAAVAARKEMEKLFTNLGLAFE